MSPEHPEQEYHPDPKSADKVHDSGTELNNIVNAAAFDDTKPAKQSKPVLTKKNDFANLPINPDTPEASDTETNKYGKKPKKAGKIIATVVFSVILLSAIGATVWFLIWRSQPEVVAMDAIVNYLSAKNLDVNGGFTVKPNDPSSTDSMTIMLRAKNAGLAHELEGTIVVYHNDDSFSLSLKEAFTKDGELYFQIDKIQEIIERTGLEFNDSISPVLNAFSNTIELVDGTWWRVKVPELLDNFDEQFTSTEKQRINDVYDCSMRAIEKATEDKSELVRIYREHPFVAVSKYDGREFDGSAPDGNLYKVDLKINELRDFVRTDFSELTIYKEIKTCFADAEMDLDDYLNKIEHSTEFVESNLNEGLFVLDIDSWSHEISGVYFSGSNDDARYYGDIVLAYPETVAIEAPKNAQPVSRLVETFFTDFSNMLYTNLNEYTSQVNR